MMTISGNVCSMFSTNHIWATGLSSTNWLKTATLTSTESSSGILGGNNPAFFTEIYTNSTRELARELKSRPKKLKSRSSSNAGTLKKQKLLKV